MTFTIKETKIIRIEETCNLLDIGDVLLHLIYIPNQVLKKQVIDDLLTYYSKKINNPNNKIRIFITYQGIIPIGLVVYDRNLEVKIDIMKFASFSWSNVENFELCKEVMDAWEHYIQKLNFKEK